MRLLSVLLLAVGCAGDKDKHSTDAEPLDEDGDGFLGDVDCDDGDASVYPDAAEIWYDGLDSDCQGDDDFDQDGDGHQAEEFGGDDCVDANASMSPELVEVPYDGLDNDCDAFTPDDDVDSDGFVIASDCDDDDALKFPGALEVVGNGEDDDCDGDVDSAPFALGDFEWYGLSRPHLAQTADWLVVAVSAASVSSPVFVPDGLSSVAVLLTLDPAGVGGAPLAVEPFFWKGEFDDDEVASVDLGTWNGALTAATTYWSAVNRFGWLMVQPLSYGGAGVGWQRLAGSFRSEPLVDFQQVDFTFDSEGTPWLCASDGDSVGYMRADNVFPSSGGEADGDGLYGCLAEPVPGGMQFTTFDSTGAPLTWSADPDAFDPTPVPSAEQLHAAEHWRSIRERDGVISAVPIDKNGVVLLQGAARTPLLDGTTVEDAEVAVASDGSLWIGAVADRGSGNEILLAHGTAASLEQSWFPSPSSDLVPVGASVLVTEDRVLLAFTGVGVGASTIEAVGWVLLGR